MKEEKKLYDSLSPTLKQVYDSQVKTIKNTSNSSTFIDVLKEEVTDMLDSNVEKKQ